MLIIAPCRKYWILSLEKKLFDLSGESLESTIYNIRDSFLLAHVSYTYFPNYAVSHANEEVFHYSTYSTAWKDHVAEGGDLRTNPIVKEGAKSILPVDWSLLSVKSNNNRRFFNNAYSFGISRNGFSFPVRDPSYGLALFSVVADLDSDRWEHFSRKNTSKFSQLATLFHNLALERPGFKKSPHPLNASEEKILGWAAKGKTAWETAQITGIAERNISYHVQSACVKLGASNKTHAVALAVKLNLVGLGQMVK